MSLRFQHITIFYETHIQQVYARQPELVERSYDDQHQAFLDEGFNWANYLCQELPKLGYETQHIIANIEPLQKRWAQEHGAVYGEATWHNDIILAQIKNFQPDILFINMEPGFIARAREVAPSIRLVYGWAGEPIVDDKRFRAHDLVLTCVPENVTFYRSAGLPCEHLNHAFYPEVLGRYSQGKAVDFGFIGNLFHGEHVHSERARLFYDIAQGLDLTVFGNVADLSPRPMGGGLKSPLREAYYTALAALYRVGMDKLADQLPRHQTVRQQMKRAIYTPIFAALRERAYPPVFGLAMYQQLASFKVCLNAHAWSAYASNMRLYEATGVGTCLLTDWKQNIAELYEPDQELVTYRSAAEAVEKAKFLLEHDDDRQRIAAAGQQRTLREHTVAHRATQLDAILRRYI